MNKGNTRSHSHFNKQKTSFESRITEASTLKSAARVSATTSNVPSSSSSSANISFNFMKDNNYPKLFMNSPLLFSFGNQPQTTKNSSLRSSTGNLFGLSNGVRTPSASSLTSSRQGFSKDYFKKNNFFSKKSTDVVIDISNKPMFREKARSSLCSTSNEPKITRNLENYQTCVPNFDTAPKSQNIKVFVRVKPAKETHSYTYGQIFRIDDKQIEVQGKIKAYDHVFPVDCTQKEVFEKVGLPIVDGIFEGYNGTIFAYGQTGSGKTHTILGGQGKGDQGLIFRAVEHLFNKNASNCKISLSLLQIYKQDLIDLLSNAKVDLKIKQTQNGQVSVQGLVKMQAESLKEALFIIQESLKNRKIASTRLNQKSSRSHTILTLYLQSSEWETKLCLIDLAGSQKVNKAGVAGQNFEELKKINYSLSCLGNVINALVTRKKTDHIPFRDSKLTRLLKDSLSGRFRTSIIVNCSSQPGTEEETMSSLKFADRAKKVKVTISKCSGKGKQNVEYLHKVIEQLTQDLETTKRQLTRYKEICTEKQEEPKPKQPSSPQVTARTTIPSERIQVEVQMKKYGKENCNANNRVQARPEKPKRSSFTLQEISSLNVSKSISNIYGEISSPSVSSLTYRQDDNIDDLSFHLSSIIREDTLREREKI